MNEDTPELTSPVPTKGTVSIRLTESSGECDTCGGYTTADLEVFLDGERIIEGHYNDHLGGDGSFNMNDQTSIAELILKTLGYTVDTTVDYVPNEDSSQYSDDDYYNLGMTDSFDPEDE